MQDNRIFPDTNILIYLFSFSEKDEKKKTVVKNIYIDNAEVSISNQVLNEFSNVLYKKYKKTAKIIKTYLTKILYITNLHLITDKTTSQALDLIDKYQLSFYDSLIVASSLSTNQNILYTEDMHNGLIIENRLKILNPFI